MSKLGPAGPQLRAIEVNFSQDSDPQALLQDHRPRH